MGGSGRPGSGLSLSRSRAGACWTCWTARRCVPALVLALLRGALAVQAAPEAAIAGTTGGVLVRDPDGLGVDIAEPA